MQSYYENEKYSFRKVRKYKWLPFGFYFDNSHYEILFEDTPIRTWEGNEETLKEIVSLMNCAYDLGHCEGSLHKELEVSHD